jgi:phosphoribosyl 1,2-cyclic phosphodiesterase
MESLMPAPPSTPSPVLTVRFWGTRGSLPAPLSAAAVRQKLRAALLKADGRRFADGAAVEQFLDHELDFATSSTYGGNSACVQLDGGGDELVLCDLGSGARELGQKILAERGPRNVYNVFLSHVHWDHIMGFPFFTPAYIPGNVIRIHGGHDVEEVLRRALVRQQSAPCFPVEFDKLGARIEFVRLQPGQRYDIAGLQVQLQKQQHSGDSYGYRFTRGGKSVVYSTDSEHKYDKLDESYPFIDFLRDADLVIFDAMYSLADAISVKEDWGHSSNIIAVELCQLARVDHLCLFHHEPVFDDATLDKVLAETIRFEAISRAAAEGARPLRVSAAYDGLELRL